MARRRAGTSQIPDAVREENALRNAARKIHVLFESMDKTLDVKERKPFLQMDIPWVGQAGYKPRLAQKRRDKAHAKEPLGEIIEYIKDDLLGDGINQYAREGEHQKYFAQAWGGTERFLEAKKYFSSMGHEREIYATENSLQALEAFVKPNSPEYKYTAASVERTKTVIADIKNRLAKFEYHIEAYKTSLQYQLKQIAAVKSFIAGGMKQSKGEFFDHIGANADTISLPQQIKETYYTDSQEHRIEQKIEDYLSQRELDDPIMMDHVRGSTADTVGAEGFTPRVMTRYFTALEKNIGTNVQGCNAMLKVCATTRKHMDDIVAKELKSAGLGK